MVLIGSAIIKLDSLAQVGESCCYNTIISNFEIDCQQFVVIFIVRILVNAIIL